MDKFVIQGGTPLHGSVEVSGAKNASLALMPASILAPGVSVFHNTPELNDVFTMLKLLVHLGVEYKFEDHRLEIDTSDLNGQDAPYEHVKKMRASVYVLSPLLSRFGRARVSLPGGCAWGPRPIDQHLKALKKMGAEIDIVEGYIEAKATTKLQGTKINFDVSSVGATGNTIMAAVMAEGTTRIQNAAKEPEITNLIKFLNQAGARISGEGTSVLEIEGVSSLAPTEIETIPDRIEAGTLLIGAAITKGKLSLKKVDPDKLDAVLLKLEEGGCNVIYNNDIIDLNAENTSIKPTDVVTSVFPGFPTDMQAQWTAFMTLAEGASQVTDTIYLDRFKHVPELSRLGADISVQENTARIKGVSKLTGAKVMSTDLRASASLVLAGLAAEGTTEVLRVYHLDRGYQRIEEKFKKLGANIERVAGAEY